VYGRGSSEIFEFSTAWVSDNHISAVLDHSHSALEADGGDRNVSEVISGKFSSDEHVFVVIVSDLCTSKVDLHILGLGNGELVVNGGLEPDLSDELGATIIDS